MEQSILKSTKKVLQIGLDDTSFDLDVMTHINSAFSTLTDLGVGDQEGFAIEDDTAEWADFLANDLVKLSKVKMFVFLHTRLLFDPPNTSFLLESMSKQKEESLWRINANQEESSWVNPDPITSIGRSK